MTTNKKKVAPVNAPPVTPEPPLVIDLPDGQKLVIGQLASGSVIEVATWRGTGRPDSRTSRLMLGMAPGSLTPTVVVPDSTNQSVAPEKKDAGYYLNALKAFPKNLFIKPKHETTQKKATEETQGKALSIKGHETKSKKAHFLDFLVRSSHEQSSEESVASAEEQTDIDKWLEEIRSRSVAPKPAAKSTKKATPARSKTRKATPPSSKSKSK